MSEHMEARGRVLQLRVTAEEKRKFWQDLLNRAIVGARKDGVILEARTVTDRNAPAMGKYMVIGLARSDRPTYQKILTLEKELEDAQR